MQELSSNRLKALAIAEVAATYESKNDDDLLDREELNSTKYKLM